MASYGGVPMIDFSVIGDLGKTYQDAQNKRTLAELGKGLADGTLDYKQAAALAAKTGDLGTTLSLLKMGGEEAANKEFQTLFNPPATPSLAPSAAPAARKPVADAAPEGGQDFGGAIASIESGGKYDLLGPVTRTGDRAFGKYQVMGANVGPWTKEVLGRPLTPQEFLASPEAQDKVFQAKFGAYAQKYGPEGAARAWFAGEGGMNDLGRKDQLGTSVAAYADKFNRNMGLKAPAGGNPGGVGVYDPLQMNPIDAMAPPVQVASLDPSAGLAPDGAQPQASAPGGAPAGVQVAQATPGPGGATGAGPFTIPPQQMNPAGNMPLGKLVAAVANPRLSAGAREAAKLMLDKAMKDSAYTDDQKEYVWHLAQGGTESQTDFIRNNKRAGATAITNDMRGENSFESEFGKKQADRWNGYIANADTARKAMVDINTMRDISTRLGSQGVAADVKETLGPYAEALGVKIDGLSDIQAYTSIVQRLAPLQRAPGSGSTSDIEFKGFLKSLPGLSQNPQAREMTLDTMEALQRHQIAEGEIASRLATKEIVRAQAEKALRDLPDPMAGFREWRRANPQVFGQALKTGAAAPAPASLSPAQNAAPQAAPARQGQQLPRFNSPADVAAAGLKSGDKFEDASGNIRIVP